MIEWGNGIEVGIRRQSIPFVIAILFLVL